MIAAAALGLAPCDVGTETSSNIMANLKQGRNS